MHNLPNQTWSNHFDNQNPPTIYAHANRLNDSITTDWRDPNVAEYADDFPWLYSPAQLSMTGDRFLN